jgi:acetyl-CoA synthetase
MDSEDPLFILYTSGSTGKPKGCLHTTGGYAVQAKITSRWIFDLHDEDIFWSTADMGWITGHTYSCYGPLLCGATFIIFEGLLIWPQPNRWCDIIDKYGVTIFYTAPTAIRMFEKLGAEVLKENKLETLRLLGSVGEPIDEAAWQWYFKEIGKERYPIVDTWWQTETGGILITSLPGIGPFKPAFTGIPFPGIVADVLGEKGESLPPNKNGNLVLRPPFAPGLLRDIYKNPKKYLETYWNQYGKEIYFTSDGAYRDENGLIRIIGRVDDVIKVAGHRVSTGELEAAINLHPRISESAVIGIPDEIKGEVPIAFAVPSEVLAEGDAENFKKELIEKIKKEIGPITLPKNVYLVKDLPKTRSGKIMRRILRRLFTGEELGDLSTLSNPEIVEDIKNIITNK